MTGRGVCFVISPIGEPGTETRKRSDQVLNHMIKPVAEAAGYVVKRADHICEPGLITTQVLTHIMESPLVVADLSEHNPNVYYELALRHANRKPLIQIIAAHERLPFDVAGIRTIKIDIHDPDSIDAARRAMQQQLRALEAGAQNDNPVSQWADLAMIKRSADPEKRALARTIEQIAELRRDLIVGLDVLAHNQRLMHQCIAPTAYRHRDEASFRTIEAPSTWMRSFEEIVEGDRSLLDVLRDASGDRQHGC